MGVADLNYKMSSKTRKEKREEFEEYLSGTKAYEGYSAPPLPAPKPT